MLDRLRELKLSDRLTLNSAGKEEGGAASTDRLRDLEPGFMVVGGDGGQGAPRMATGGRLAVAPAAPRATAGIRSPWSHAIQVGRGSSCSQSGPHRIRQSCMGCVPGPERHYALVDQKTGDVSVTTLVMISGRAPITDSVSARQ
jgi:hypothetical protein